MKKLITANSRNQWNLSRLFFIKHQILILLAPYFTSSISSISRKYTTKLAHLMPQLGIGLSIFFIVTLGQAGIPVWSFTSDPYFPPKASVTSTGTALVKYIVTNNSSKAHNLVILTQTGVSQSGGPCSLGPKGTCTLTLTITGSALPASGLSGGPVLCQTYPDRITPNPNDCYRTNQGDSLAVTLIPHNLSMLPIPIQEGTANQPFVYNLKQAVKFYDENVTAGLPVQGIVSPAGHAGLRFDQNSFSIVGTPTRTGTYLFKVGAKNLNGSAAPTDFKVQVSVNLKDKPVFKQHYPVASAFPEQKYSMNLMELIEPQKGFMATNQISFSINPNFNNPDWLHIAKEDATLLVGKVPPEAAGKEIAVTLIASSNTGGDSDPFTVRIPIAYDPAKKPVIKAFELEKLVGTNIYEDLSSYIKDPAHAPDLEVILEKVEPAASWLRISSLNPTVLEGTVPKEATGQNFKLTLHASTSIGGSSDPITIPLQICVDKEQIPQFKSANPVIPMLYPGQPFFYDFVTNKDVYPEYNDAPYEIQFAENYEHPAWLRIETNKLIADFVPKDIDDDIDINVVIKNIPGGLSGVYQLSLTVMY